MDQKYIDRFHTKYKVMSNGCWVWTAATATIGYGQFWAGYSTYGHRFSYLIHKGDPGSMSVCHTCDNPSCVNPDHLWLGTYADNNRDKVLKGRSLKGEKNHTAKLTEEDVLAIRASTEDSVTLAKRYNINRNHVYHILKRKSWKHI